MQKHTYIYYVYSKTITSNRRIILYIFGKKKKKGTQKREQEIHSEKERKKERKRERKKKRKKEPTRTRNLSLN